MKIVKSQISVEYVMLVGFLMVIIIPLIIFYYNYSLETNDKLIAQQINHISKRIVDAADSVYYLGKPSQTIIKAYIPQNVKEALIQNNEIVYKINTKLGISEIVQISKVNLTGTLPTSQGIHHITIKAFENYVQISSN